MGVQETFCKGDCLFVQGDESHSLYVVLRGRVKLVRQASNGSTTIIDIASTGDELTAAALFDCRPYLGSAKALTDGTVFKMSDAQFHALLVEMPVVVSNILRDLGARYHGLVENFTSLAAYKVEGRLCKVMAGLARRYGIEGDSRGVILDLAITRQDLAEIVGTTLETTIRTLNRLRREGAILWEGKRFFIPNIGALESLAVTCSRTINS